MCLLNLKPAQLVTSGLAIGLELHISSQWSHMMLLVLDNVFFVGASIMAHRQSSKRHI